MVPDSPKLLNSSFPIAKYSPKHLNFCVEVICLGGFTAKAQKKKQFKLS